MQWLRLRMSKEQMVALPVWISNLMAYSLQIAILAVAGTMLAYLFRLKLPRLTLIFWQILLLVCLIVPVLQPWNHPIVGAAISGNRLAGQGVHGVAVSMSPGPSPQFPWEIIGILLLTGMVLRLMWMILGFLRLHLFHRKSHMFLEDHEAIRDLRWRTGVRVPLLLSDEIDCPVTFGFRSPTIILPLSFKDLSEPCQRAVLCHELLHVRRYDWILIILEEIVASIFWFHPAVWWLLNRIHLVREQTVDSEVVRLTGDKQPYLDSLLEFAKAHGRPRAVPAPLFLKESHLVQRVALLLKEVSMSRSRLAVSMISIFLLLMGTVYLSAGWFPLTGAPLPAQEQNSGEQVQAPHVLTRQGGANMQEPKLIHRVEPVYPEEAKRIGLQGIVRLAVTIDEEGLVREIKVLDGPPLLIDPAINAVKQWRYSPTLLNGAPVPVETTVMCYFAIKNTAAPVREASAAAASGVGAPPDTRTMTLMMHIVNDGQAAATPLSVPPAQEQNAAPQINAPLREPIVVGSMVQESKLIHRVEPIYPEQALRERLQGIVRLMITINEDGYVYELRTTEGNNPILEAAAIDAVKQWQYSPTLLNGVPVAAQTTVTVIFNVK